MSVSVPALVAGTSIDVLSVSISNRFSPGFTESPAALNHFVILPSATVSPSCGIRTSIPILLFSPNLVSRLRNLKAFDCEVQLKFEKFCERASRYLVPEIAVSEKLHNYARCSSTRSQLTKELSMRHQSINQLRNLCRKPLIIDLVANAVAPTRISIRSL